MLLRRLLQDSETIISGFRACGIYPFDRQQVLKRIRVSDEEIIRAAKSHLGSSFIAALEQNVGIGKAPSTRSQNR